MRFENERLLRQPPALVLQLRKLDPQVELDRQLASGDSVLEAPHVPDESLRVQWLHPRAVREINHVPRAVDGRGEEKLEVNLPRNDA